MAALLLSRAIPFLRLGLHQRHLVICNLNYLNRYFTAESAERTEDAAYGGRSKASLSAKDKWKEKENEILKAINPFSVFAKDILHSDRYANGQRLNTYDEKFVVEKLLAYHPNSEDKIGCGLDSIVVGRHSQYRRTRCFYVVRTDGRWINFSYRKCVRAYIRKRYPYYAKGFIAQHINK